MLFGFGFHGILPTLAGEKYPDDYYYYYDQSEGRVLGNDGNITQLQLDRTYQDQTNKIQYTLQILGVSQLSTESKNQRILFLFLILDLFRCLSRNGLVRNGL